MRFIFPVAAALLLAEILIALFGLDARLISPLLLYHRDNPQIHRPSADPQLVYELVPNSSCVTWTGKTATINDLGFRGRAHPAEKPKGTFRIVCLGGSNTFGYAVEDERTYPAYLEKELNKRGGRFEVWNAGDTASILAQDVARAREIVKRYQPDLLLFQISNSGRRAFLPGSDPRPTFARDPTLYQENLLLRPRARLDSFLLAHWRLYRLALIVYNRRRVERWSEIADDQTRNDAALQAFAREQRGKTAVALFVHPGGELRQSLKNMGLKTLELRRRLPPDAGGEYSDIHPPAEVYAWYARELARFITRD